MQEDLDDYSIFSLESDYSNESGERQIKHVGVFFKPIFETGSSDDECDEESHPRQTSLFVKESDMNETFVRALLENFASTTVMMQMKSKGVLNEHPSPGFSLIECIWTFAGSFTIIFILCFLSTNITLWNDHGLAFPLGKFLQKSFNF